MHPESNQSGSALLRIAEKKGETDMAKTDNPHAVRLYNSLLQHTDAETAARIAHKIPLSKSADYEKKFMWAQSICADLEEAFNAETIKIIRMDCACGPEKGQSNTLKKIWQRSDGFADFVQKANKSAKGFTLLYEDEALFLIYPQCYCSCVKRVDKTLPAAWCACTLGYAARMFESVFERPVTVALMESVKQGGTQCKIKIVCAQ